MTTGTSKRTRYMVMTVIMVIFLSLSLSPNSANKELYNVNIRKSTSEYLLDYKLQYSSYFGGVENIYSPYEFGEVVAVDPEGCPWIVGISSAPDFPIVGGGINSTPYGDSLFIMKLTPDGSEILYSTYLTSTGETIPIDMAIDHNGDVWIVGKTFATDFPTTPNALFTTSTNVSYYPDVSDGFICKISGTDGSLAYSSYFGGDDVSINSISISNLGYIWIAGVTDSDNLPFTANAVETTYGGGDSDGFICQLSSNAEILLFCSLWGGDGNDRIVDTAMDKADLWITGLTTSLPIRGGFPVSDNALDDTLDGTSDVFIGQINNSVRKFPSFGYCSYLGGSDGEIGRSILVDDGSKIWVIGDTDSTDFPTEHYYDPSFNGGRDLFIFSMRHQYVEGIFVPIIDNSSYFGGDDYDYVSGACLDKDGSIWMTGSTESEDLPIVDGYDRLASSVAGFEDAYVVRMDSNMRNVQYSTFIGGSGFDVASDIKYDVLNDRIWVTGMAQYGLPLVDPYDDQLDGYTDIFVSYFGPSMAPTPPRDLSGILSLDGKILLTWGFPEDSEDSLIQYYKVFRGLSEVGVAYYAESTGLSFVDEDITTNTSYFYTVTAVNGVGESEHSNMFQMAIPDISNFTDLLESVPESTPASGVIFSIAVMGIVVMLRRKRKLIIDR